MVRVNIYMSKENRDILKRAAKELNLSLSKYFLYLHCAHKNNISLSGNKICAHKIKESDNNCAHKIDITKFPYVDKNQDCAHKHNQPIENKKETKYITICGKKVVVKECDEDESNE